MKTKVALGLLTAISVVGAIIGSRTVYTKQKDLHKRVELWKDRFYEKLTQDDIAWG